mgnify:CR=1 FL=1
MQNVKLKEYKIQYLHFMFFFYLATINKKKYAEENCSIWGITLGFSSLR